MPSKGKKSILAPLDGKKVKIGTHRFDVSVRKGLWPLNPNDVKSNKNNLGKESHAYGYMCPASLELAFSSELADSMALETMLHEFLHALCELTGCREDFKLGREEQIVQALGHGLAGILMENKHVMTIINDIVGKKRGRR